MGQKKSRKIPSKFPTKFSKFPCENKKFTNEVLQERREKTPSFFPFEAFRREYDQSFAQPVLGLKSAE